MQAENAQLRAGVSNVWPADEFNMASEKIFNQFRQYCNVS